MPIGVIINALSVAAGGVIGALFGHKLPAKINSELTKIFGICSMGMGVSSIGLMKNMPAVIFAVIIGTAFGLAVNLGGIINGGATCMVIVVVCLIGMMAGSCFGIFFSGEDSGTGMTMRDAAREINQEYNEKIEKIKTDNPYDKLILSGSRATWPEILSI